MINMYGVFCEYFNDCAHYVLKYVCETKPQADAWAEKTEGLNTFCKVRELKLGEFEDINSFDKDDN